MDDEEKIPTLRESDDGIALLAADGGIFDAKQRIEEDLTCLLKGNAMLCQVCRVLLDIPKEALALVEEGEIRYRKYIRCIYV